MYRLGFGLILSLAIVAACGGGAGRPDGPAFDDDIDADPGDDAVPDAGPAGTASVRILDGSLHQPVVGAGVAVVEPGVTTALYTTDATGTAELTLHPHAQVWIRTEPEVTSPYGEIIFIADMSPGDVLNLGQSIPAVPSAAGLLRITYPPLAGAVAYHADDLGPCTTPHDAGPGVFAYELSFGCDGHPRELVVRAYNASGALLGYLHVPGVALAGDQMVDAGSLSWTTDEQTTFASYTGLPSNVFEGSFRRYSDASWAHPGGAGSLSGGGGSWGGSGPPHAESGPSMILTVLDGRDAEGWGTQLLDDVAPAPDANHAIDPHTLLPFISQPTYDVGSRSVRWSRITPGDLAPQLITGYFIHNEQVWRYFAPGDATEITFPDAPDELTPSDLGAGFMTTPNVYQWYLEGSSYRDLLLDADAHRFELNQRPHRPLARGRVSYR